MSYLVLARRKRPQSLNRLVGQDSIRGALKGMLESHKIPHAFLFTGTRGTGKTSTARILAKSLNCTNGPTVEPCQTCRHCEQISHCSHEDVIEMDAASHTGVDNIRELRESARFHPVSAKYKIFIIDEVHMLSTGAFNALLKILEEPPQKVIFILATTELYKIPVTIRSRCLTFAFKKIVFEKIYAHLSDILEAENVSYEPDSIKLIAREAQGSLRDALSLLEQVLSLNVSGEMLTVEQTKQSLGLQNDETALQLFQHICFKQDAEALEILQKADDLSVDLSVLLDSTARYFRYAILLKSLQENKPFSTDLLQDEYELIQSASSGLDSVAIKEIFKILSMSIKDLQRSIHPLSWAEITIIDAISRAEWISAADMLIKAQANSSPSQVESKTPQKPQILQTPKTSSPKTDLKAEHDVDLELYKEFVSAARKRSQTLGARLNFVKLKVFKRDSIVFADTAENKTYLSFDASDRQNFWKSLEDVGINPEALHGKNVKESFVSLYQVSENEKKEAYSLKEKEILSRESVKNLMILSKEIKLTPIEK